jgi:hypothetical protein
MSRTTSWTFLPVLCLVGALGAAPGALAQTSKPLATTPSAINETQGATTGLGSSHRFTTKAAAFDHCANDTVVWSASPDLLYVLPSSPDYGKGHGFYACKAEADDAGFHASGN